MADPISRQKVVVVGAGPVGALAALYAAQRSDDVEVYELRGDLRNSSTTPLNFTKSINLALSERGINSIRKAKRDGLLDSIVEETIPMYGRMIHGRNKLGEMYDDSQAYDVHGRAILAVDRSGLNKKLLNALEDLPNVKFFFNHKLTGVDLNTHRAWFEERSMKPDQSQAKALHDTSPPSDGDPEVEVGFDLLIGADGAHSASRHHLMRYARLNYQQEYIDTLWCEFHIAPKNQDFAISPHHLHIWPGGAFMFIAIPSLDRSFTCTLFASQAIFDHMAQQSENVPTFFDEHFPGVSPGLIAREDLIQQFASSPHLPLISIKCKPYHFTSSAVILGDAAHAMVPFYGQGMNAGLEDVRVLFEQLDQHGVYSTADTHTRQLARAMALEAYSDFRAPDASAISELALRNYHEMSSAVTSPIYLVRKFIEERMSKYLPWFGWSTQYSRVSFGNDRYSEVEKTARWQGTALLSGFAVAQLGVLGVVGYSIVRWHRSHTNDFFARLLGT